MNWSGLRNPVKPLERLFLGIQHPFWWVIRAYCPFLGTLLPLVARVTAYAVTAAIAAGVVLAVIATPGLAIEVFGRGLDRAVAWTTALPLHATGAFLAVYAIGIAAYRPRDRNKYKADHEPEWLKMWEGTLEAICTFVALLTTYYVLSFVEALPVSALPLSLGVAAVCSWRFRRFVTSRTANQLPSGKTRGRVTAILFWTWLGAIPLWTLYLAQAEFGIDLLFYGDVDDLRTALFFPHLCAMLWLARKFRWMLYEDAWGFETIEPSIRGWNAAVRLPLMGAVCVVFLDATYALHPAVIAASFAPLALVPVYFLLRYAKLGGTMVATPRGDYWAFNEVEKREYKLTHGWPLLTGGKKAPEPSERFATKARKFNRLLDDLSDQMDEHLPREERVHLSAASNDPEDFDYQSLYSMLDAAEPAIEQCPGQKGYVTLREARTTLDEMQTEHKSYVGIERPQ